MKIALILVVMIVTFILQASLSKDVVNGSRARGTSLAIISILLWVGIICAGRWIAYSYVE
jgi:hypothetical protein